MDANQAIYEWNYRRQLLAIKAHEKDDLGADQVEAEIFSDRFLLRRPLLEAISADRSPVLLIDEIDRADEEFEAYLLEILADFQITIPELGAIKATSIPHVILTSNGTRELSDALRRRCLYAYVDFPSEARELDVLDAGEPRLMRVKPRDEVDQPVDRDGVELHGSSCPSGGTVDFFLEPTRQHLRLVILGNSPVAAALMRLGRAMGYQTIAAPGPRTSRRRNRRTSRSRASISAGSRCGNGTPSWSRPKASATARHWRLHSAHRPAMSA